MGLYIAIGEENLTTSRLVQDLHNTNYALCFSTRTKQPRLGMIRYFIVAILVVAPFATAEDSEQCDPNWADGEDWTCDDYADGCWCLNGEKGPNWDDDNWGKFLEQKDDQGRTALVCPQCGCQLDDGTPYANPWCQVPDYIPSACDFAAYGIKSCSDIKAIFLDNENNEMGLNLPAYCNSEWKDRYECPSDDDKLGFVRDSCKEMCKSIEGSGSIPESNEFDDDCMDRIPSEECIEADEEPKWMCDDIDWAARNCAKTCDLCFFHS